MTGCKENYSLNDWLDWLETLHPQEIELGLERVSEVYERLNPAHRPLARQVIMVAGTNGKGSCVAMLEAILLTAGYSVGSYTSPHLRYYNERVRIGGIDMDDMTLCRSFARVEVARGKTSLSYFEFGTLAAFDIFSRYKLDVALLEVGLGGRLDSVNIAEPDISVITSIGIDHEDWLGHDRDSIGIEKAGVMRTGKVTVCGERDLPQSVRDVAMQKGARLQCIGEDFDYRRNRDSWDWSGTGEYELTDLAVPGLQGECQYNNAATVLATLQNLELFPVDQADIDEGLEEAHCRGRFEVDIDDPHLIYDVAHNRDSAAALAGILVSRAIEGETRVVFGVMADKDIGAIVARLSAQVDRWYLAAPAVVRAAEPGVVEKVCIDKGISRRAISKYGSVQEALEQARKGATEVDRIVVCGSFYTVAEAMSQQV